MRTEDIIELFLPKGTDDLANAIGPQGNLIDELNIFNDKYMLPAEGQPLKVTKKWRWAPGTYDRVKVAYTRKVMQWHRRPRYMHSLFERKRTWFENDMKRELNDIEQYLISARRDNAIWLDENTDSGVLEQVTAEFAYKIKKLYEIVEAEYDSFEVHTAQKRDLWPHQNYGGPRDEGLNIADGIYILTIDMPEKPIEVTRNRVVIGTVPFPALSLSIMIDVPRWISHSMFPQTINVNSYNNRNQEYFNIAVYYEVPHKWFTGDENDDKMLGGQHWPILHPFIQRTGYHEDAFRPWHWRNICWGDYGNDIINSFMMMDWDAFFLFINQWLYQYEMTNANPLNNIRTSFLGIGSDTSTEMLDIVGYRDVDCANRLTRIFSTGSDLHLPQYNIRKILNYCENVRDCSLRHEGEAQCIGYKRNIITNDHAELIDGMINKEIDTPLSRQQAIYIHKEMRNHFGLNSDYPYYGTENVYKRLFKGDDQPIIELYVKYTAMFEGSLFQMALMDQTVISYALVNKYWDAYLRIFAFSYLMKSGSRLEGTKWNEIMEKTIKNLDLVFQGILRAMTKKQVKKSTVETEADKTRAEMMKWASQVSGGRISSEEFDIHDVFPNQDTNFGNHRPASEEEFEIVNDIENSESSI